jgi:hypothetical protein
LIKKVFFFFVLVGALTAGQCLYSANQFESLEHAISTGESKAVFADLIRKAYFNERSVAGSDQPLREAMSRERVLNILLTHKAGPNPQYMGVALEEVLKEGAIYQFNVDCDTLHGFFQLYSPSVKAYANEEPMAVERLKKIELALIYAGADTTFAGNWLREYASSKIIQGARFSPPFHLELLTGFKRVSQIKTEALQRAPGDIPQELIAAVIEQKQLENFSNNNLLKTELLPAGIQGICQKFLGSQSILNRSKLFSRQIRLIRKNMAPDFYPRPFESKNRILSRRSRNKKFDKVR